MSKKVLLGKRTEKFMYDSLRVLSCLRLIPFYVVADPHGDRQNISKKSPTTIQNRKLVRFEKSSRDIWLYYVMTTFYFVMNGSKILIFLSPLLGKGIQMDIHFGGDMFFFSAMFFSGVFKFTILFCVNDLIFLLNQVDQWIHTMQENTKGGEQGVPVGSVDEKSANSGILVGGAWTKYTWYCSTEGILGVWWTAFTGHAAWFVLTVMGIYKSDERQLGTGWMALECVLVTFVAGVDCFMSITSVYLTVAIIVQLKLSLTQFEDMGQLLIQRSKIGSKLSHFIQRYKSLVVFCAYGNGYYRVLFPGYIGVVQFIVLALLYVALTGHRYLPFFIYWTYPAASIFVFCILLLLVLSQVGNIFRQSAMVCHRLQRQLVREFSAPSTSSFGNSSSTRQLTVVELDTEIKPTVIDLLPNNSTNTVERECLQRKMETIRSFGFYSGFYGAVDQNTPASMTANICNCMILLLSFG